MSSRFTKVTPRPVDVMPKKPLSAEERLARALQEIKEIRKAGGRPLTPREKAAWRRRHLAWPVVHGWPLQRRPTTIIKRKRDGSTVYRLAGRRGPDLDRLPLTLELERHQQACTTIANKLERKGRALMMQRDASRKGAAASKRKGQGTRALVLALAAENQRRGRNLASFIAKKAGVTPAYVRLILKLKKRK